MGEWQTVQTLIICWIGWHLIWVCTACRGMSVRLWVDMLNTFVITNKKTISLIMIFRLINMPVSSLTPAEQNRTELQMWVPSLEQYLKVGQVYSTIIRGLDKFVAWYFELAVSHSSENCVLSTLISIFWLCPFLPYLHYVHPRITLDMWPCEKRKLWCIHKHQRPGW